MGYVGKSTQNIFHTRQKLTFGILTAGSDVINGAEDTRKGKKVVTLCIHVKMVDIRAQF